MTGTAYTQLGLIEPGIGDPSTKNAWGTLLNTNDALLDTVTSQTVTKSVAGTGTTQLTFTNGAADETKHAHFVFNGALTGDRLVLWPQNVQCTFSVQNNTTGAHTLTLGADNGGGSAAGTTQVLTQGNAGIFVSDGTNVNVRVSPPTPATNFPIILASGSVTLAATFLSLDLSSYGSTYSRIEVQVDGLAYSSTFATIVAQLSNTAAVSWITSGYFWSTQILSSGFVSHNSASDASMLIKYDAGDLQMFTAALDGVGTANAAYFVCTAWIKESSFPAIEFSGGGHATTGINGIRFTLSTGAATAGKYRVIGYT